VFCKVPQVHRVHFRCQPKPEYGHQVEVPLIQDRRIDIFRKKLAESVETFADVVSNLLEVGAPRKPQLYPGAFLSRRGLDPLNVADGAHCLLEGPGNERLDLLRSGALIRNHNIERRPGDVRHQVDRKTAERYSAHHYDDQKRHHRGDGSVNGCLGKFHRKILGGL
jgi:hypothetical protein